MSCKKISIFILVSTVIACQARAYAQKQGTLRGVVFSEVGDRPLAGVKLSRVGAAQGEVFLQSTNDDGAFDVHLPPGSDVLKLEASGFTAARTPPLPVIAGEITEAVITLFLNGKAKVKIEVPGKSSNVHIDKTEKKIEGPTGIVRGTLLHDEKGTPVAQARILVRQSAVEAVSDQGGHYSLILPVGTYDLTVIHPKFNTQSKNAVVVAEGEPTVLNLKLTPSGILLDDFTVVAPKILGSTLELLNERRTSGNVQDVIGAEQISKSGDSDAAGALKRVTGVTVVDGKYIYVRGLGERYSSTLFNGSTLPSPEPMKRVVPLDLFPADLLESVVIQKTFSPDMPGEFGGGVVQLRTRSFPKTFKANLQISTGAVLGTTFVDGITYEGGPTDFWGVDGGFRALPQSVAEATSKSLLLERDMFSEKGFTAEELEALGEAMPNRWNTLEAPVAPNFGLTGSIGDAYSLFGGKAGFLFGLIFANGYAAEHDKIENYYTSSTVFTGKEDPAQGGHRYISEKMDNDISLSGILNLGWEKGDEHQVQLTSVVARVTNKETRTYGGFNRDLGSDLRVSRLGWIERMLIVEQLVGKHVIPPLWDTEVGYRYTFAKASRYEPDRREVRFDLEPKTGDWTLSDRPEGNQRLFSDLLDTKHDAGLYFSVPFKQWTRETAKIKAGADYTRKDRDVDVLRFTFRRRGPKSSDPNILKLDPESIFTKENIGADGFIFTDTTLATDNYIGNMSVMSGYLMTDFPLGWKLRLVGGVRVERASQYVETFKPFSADQKERQFADLTNTDMMPAATLSWEIKEKMLLRFAFAKTVNRPSLRELSPAVSYTTTGGKLYQGNPDVDRAKIQHFDLRWEWYFGDGETVSLSSFFKTFESPIELVAIPSAQISVMPDNAEGATNYGMEFEGRKSMAFVHPTLADLFFSINTAWIRSNIELAPGNIQTSTERPLQGQSPFVFNIQLSYDNIDIGTTATLLYNVFGRRIAEVGVQGSPDVYEEPFHQLDFVYKQKLPWGFSLSLKFKNILDPLVHYTQGDLTTEKYRKGRVVSFAIAKSFF